MLCVTEFLCLKRPSEAPAAFNGGSSLKKKKKRELSRCFDLPCSFQKSGGEENENRAVDCQLVLVNGYINRQG